MELVLAVEAIAPQAMSVRLIEVDIGEALGAGQGNELFGISLALFVDGKRVLHGPAAAVHTPQFRVVDQRGIIFRGAALPTPIHIAQGARLLVIQSAIGPPPHTLVVQHVRLIH